MRRVLREPLLHFLVAGVVIFAVERGLREEAAPPAPPVVLTEGFVEGLRLEAARRGGGEGADEEALVRTYLREEALFREAKRLGLDRGDELVRRRLIQKMEFLLRSGVEVGEPSDGELRALLEAEPERFRQPARLHFTHVFFDPARRQDAEGDARALLAELGPETERAEGRGDLFLRGYAFDAPLPALRGEFGGGLVAAAMEAPVGRWSGPIRSRFGVHLLRVEERRPERRATLEEARGALVDAWTRDATEERFEAAVGRLVEALPLEDPREARP